LTFFQSLMRHMVKNRLSCIGSRSKGYDQSTHRDPTLVFAGSCRSKIDLLLPNAHLIREQVFWAHATTQNWYFCKNPYYAKVSIDERFTQWSWIFYWKLLSMNSVCGKNFKYSSCTDHQIYGQEGAQHQHFHHNFRYLQKIKGGSVSLEFCFGERVIYHE
jgi:hypothetical protein